MTFISRAIRYVLRKRVKTAIVFVILALISTLLLASSAVAIAAEKEGKKVEEQAESSFVLANNPQVNPGTPRGAGTVKPSDVKKIASLKNVDSYVLRQNVTADLVGAKAARIKGVQDYDARREKQFGNAVNLEGTNSSKGLNAFKTKSIHMVKGRALQESDEHASLIHEDLAKLNGLKLGDSLTLKANPFDADNLNHSTEQVKTRIVGIYGGANNRPVATRAELTANTVYTDLKTTRELYKYKPGKEIYQDASFKVKKGVDADSVIEEASKLPIDLQNYQITRDDQFVQGMIGAAKGVKSMMNITVIAVSAFAVIALGLVLILWINERRKEIGVLTSIGVGKASLVLQQLFELVLLAIPAIAIGYGFASAISPWISDCALGSVKNSAAQQLSSMGQAGGNLESSMATRTLDKIAVHASLDCLIQSSLMVLMVIVVAVALSYLPILRKSPRDLLGMQK
ncbi:ABC transporter permease [Gardnerella vaginalis]|uniref:ABC transporter permease n=1 Tax=Gardnerella vaginalis TaxID=2702 RepID=UPI0039EFD4DE